MRKHYFISNLIISWIVCITVIYAKELPLRNIDLIDSLLFEYSKNLAEFLTEKNIKSVEMKLNSHPAENFLKRNIVQAFAEKGIEVYQFYEQNQNNTLILLDIKDISVKYSIVKNSEQLQRIFNISIVGMMRDKNHKLDLIPEVSIEHKEIIEWSDLDHIEHSPFDFAKSTRPEHKESFFKKIAEPAIIIGSALITLILLFTVRSD